MSVFEEMGLGSRIGTPYENTVEKYPKPWGKKERLAALDAMTLAKKLFGCGRAAVRVMPDGTHSIGKLWPLRYEPVYEGRNWKEVFAKVREEK